MQHRARQPAGDDDEDHVDDRQQGVGPPAQGQPAGSPAFTRTRVRSHAHATASRRARRVW